VGAAAVILVFWCSAPTRACDPSFVLAQPLYRIVSPTEDATDVSFKSPRLVIATDGESFSNVERVRLVPESGKPIDLRTDDVSTRAADLSDISFTSLYGRPAALSAIRLKNLNPSTTYELIFVTRTQNAPGCPRTLTEHVGRFTTEAATALDAFGDFAEVPDSPPTGAAGAMSGQSVFDRSRDVLRTLRYPSFISFIVHVRSTIGGKPFIESFRSIVRSQDDVVLTHKIPIESTSKPDNPYGTSFAILGMRFETHSQGHQEEPFGVPQISPLYSFGLRPFGEVLPLMPTPPPEPTDLRSLGRIETIAQEYDVTLLGIEKYRVRWSYHLKLSPRERPDTYRLREMWVDTQTFVPWKLVSAGIFPKGPASQVSWDVTYTMIHGYWVMAEESTVAPLRVGGILEGSTSRGYQGLAYAFSDFQFPKNLEDFSFFDVGSSDAAEY
jgi:hypothetical protein